MIVVLVFMFNGQGVEACTILSLAIIHYVLDIIKVIFNACPIQLSYAAVANTHSEDHRRKRQSESEFKPIRIKAIFGSTVEALPAEQQKLLKVYTVHSHDSLCS